MRHASVINWRDGVTPPLFSTSEASETTTTLPISKAQAIREGKYLSLTDSIQLEDMSKRTTNPFVESDLPSNRASRVSRAEIDTIYEHSIAESAVPSPLQPGRRSRLAFLPPLEQSVIHRSRPTPWEAPSAPARAYGGSAGKVQEQLGIEEMDVNHYYLDPETAVPPLRPPSKSLRDSIGRFSITPSEMPYPIGLLSSTEPNDYTKAQQMLGLRRQSRPPPVPPKTASWSSSASYNKPLPATKLEPQNGRIAWLHAITAVFIVFNCWGLANAFGLFQAFYESYYLPHYSPSSIAWIGSTQLALVFGLGVPVGRLVDKGYFRSMFHSGTALMIVGIFCTAWCKDLWSLWLVQGLVTGLGMGMLFCSGIVALMTWFDERKIGIAMGLGAAGSCVGGIVYVLIARHFLVTNGFATTMRIIGGVAAVTMIPPNLVFCMRGQRHRDTHSGGRPGSRVTIRSSTNRRSWQTLKTCLSASYILAAAGMFFAFLGIYFGFVYMVTFASTVLKLSNTASTNLLIFMLAANLPGRFLPALISDRCIGPLNTIFPSIFLSAGVIVLWIASGEHNRGALTVIACFYGFVSAGVQVLYAPTVYTFCLEPTTATSRAGAEPPTPEAQLATDRIGLKAGGIFTCVGLACLIGTPIGGALITYRANRGLNNTYLGAQIFAAVSLLLSGCLLLASRVARIGWQARRA